MKRRVVVASNNPAKLKEIAEIIGPLGYEAIAVGEVVPDFAVEETGATFEENAKLKAKAAAEQAGEVAVADDSGLEVEALGGAPGIYSARYAATDEARINRLLAEMRGKQKRKARFVCVVAACTPRGECLAAEGQVAGRIVEAPRGSGGFGYDPVFQPEGEERTFAEMSAEEKHRLSHRGRAFAQLPELLKQLARLAQE